MIDLIADLTVGDDPNVFLPYQTWRRFIGFPWFSRVTENQGSVPEREPEKWLPLPRKAAGAQITQYWFGEVVTRNIGTVPIRYGVWNENNLKILTRNNRRASLVPAAAVIPAPVAYMKVAAVKKLVVGFRSIRVQVHFFLGWVLDPNFLHSAEWGFESCWAFQCSLELPFGVVEGARGVSMG